MDEALFAAGVRVQTVKVRVLLAFDVPLLLPTILTGSVHLVLQRYRLPILRPSAVIILIASSFRSGELCSACEWIHVFFFGGLLRVVMPSNRELSAWFCFADCRLDRYSGRRGAFVLVLLPWLGLTESRSDSYGTVREISRRCCS